MSWRHGILALGVACTALTACYKYVPVEPDAQLERGRGVRIHLERPTDFRLTEVGANDVVELRAEVIGWRSDSLATSVFWLRGSTGFEHRAEGETILIAGDNIQRLERKDLDVPRTTGLTIGMAALAGVVGVAVSAGGSEGDGDGNGPPPTD